MLVETGVETISTDVGSDLAVLNFLIAKVRD